MLKVDNNHCRSIFPKEFSLEITKNAIEYKFEYSEAYMVQSIYMY